MNRSLLAAAIALAFGATAPAWGNPTNNSTRVRGDLSQTATADSTL